MLYTQRPKWADASRAAVARAATVCAAWKRESKERGLPRVHQAGTGTRGQAFCGLCQSVEAAVRSLLTTSHSELVRVQVATRALLASHNLRAPTCFEMMFPARATVLLCRRGLCPEALGLLQRLQQGNALLMTLGDPAFQAFRPRAASAEGSDPAGAARAACTVPGTLVCADALQP